MFSQDYLYKDYIFNFVDPTYQEFNKALIGPEGPALYLKAFNNKELEQFQGIPVFKRFLASAGLWGTGLTICWYDNRLPILKNIKTLKARWTTRLGIVLIPVTMLGMYFNISEKLRIDKLHGKHYQNYLKFMRTGDETIFEKIYEGEKQK